MSYLELELARFPTHGHATRTAFTQESPLVGGRAIAQTSILGLGAENLGDIWDHTIGVSSQAAREITGTRSRVIRALVDAGDFYRPDQYQVVGFPERILTDGKPIVLPAHPDLRRLFALVEKTLQAHFLTESYAKFRPVADPSQVDHSVRYSVLGALAISHEIAKPSLSVEPGHLHRDVRFYDDGGLDVQLDALVTRQAYPQIVTAQDLLTYLDSSDTPDWGIIQIKLITYKPLDKLGVLKEVISRHHLEARRQLVSLALALSQDVKLELGKGVVEAIKSPFIFPGSIYFVYIRPTPVSAK
ncbi:MAG: hypothetical protein UU42_C0009G0001 [Candidatus Woesebacteria bacterium GW2011_GWA1_41_13b]|uniref:Uncharacterized protein n=1 Tax=Candidatus Woesebacteria bacterium GW2011_GWA1_41_13b TaxID=1618555 RepID=A0A0G0US80_9BACT|nr:MAG: hypothetical protein UU42_C0009G0001 [Candidatus Woesebacteria bacterium GW2011_GWA1_41_13b]KKT77176.1 MAG: hypothetical protein UW73_C0026G0001 [Microgenomates group bacterium GW2011_GWB1_44_8]